MRTPCPPRQRSSRAAAAAALLLGFVSVSAFPLVARADGAQLDRFEPSERGSRFFAADSLELSGKLGLTTGLVATYGRRLRAFGDGAEGTAHHLVSDELVLHPGATLVMAPGARFGVDLPLVLQSGTPTNLAGQYYPDPASPALGDARLSFDLRVAGPEAPAAEGVTAAAGVALYLPSGSRDNYTGDDYTRFALRGGGAVRFGWLRAALRVGYMYRRDLGSFGDLRLGSELDGTLGLGWARGPWTVGPELRASTILRDEAFQRRASPVEALLGAHYVTGDFAFGAGIGPSIVRGLGAPDFRTVLSFEWRPLADRASEHDRDGDGVSDADDLCPDVPGPPGGPANGCPVGPPASDVEPPRDSPAPAAPAPRAPDVEPDGEGA